MEVLLPLHNMKFDFDSPRSSPSTPKLSGGYYLSAPASPTRLSQVYNDYDDFLMSTRDSATARPDRRSLTEDNVNSLMSHDEFAFDVGNEQKRTSLSAEELFDGGVIKLLKPQPPPRSPVRRMSAGLFSSDRGRLRERAPANVVSSGRRASRSLSPLRVSAYPWEADPEQKRNNVKEHSSSTCSAIAVPSWSSRSYKKWKLKDFFLFRSASEGRAADRDPLKKYAGIFRRYEDARKAGSSAGEVDSAASGSSSRRRGHVSAHERHYTVNRAVSDDMKKKTFLPYKQGILGRLAFNPAVHALANGFGLSRK